MLMYVTLSLALLAQPSQEVADAAYNAGEFRKAFDLFLELADDASVHRPDAIHGAHASLIALHEETGEAEHLCRALDLTRELLVSESFADDDELAVWVEIEAKDVERIRHQKITCTATPPTAPAKALATDVQPIEPDVESLLPVTGGSSPVRSRQAHRGRGMVIAGGITLGGGLAVTATAGYLGGSMLDIWRESNALHDETGPIGTEAQAAKNAALTREYERQRAPMLATAIVGASAVIVGAVLVGVGARRLARATSRTALLPTPGGLVLRARF